MVYTLRKWQKSDIHNLPSHANNKKIADNLRNAFPRPYTPNDAKIYINSIIKSDEKTQCCRAIDINGEAVGSIGIFVKDDVYCKSAEIGYWLAEPYWGQGIMTSAVKEICGYAFKNYDLVRIFAEVYDYNIASQNVLKKAGFVLEGILKKSVYKNYKYYDSCLFALVKD